jgi:hypothetical protein
MATNIFTRLEKRKAFPLDVDGEVIHITEPTMGQISRIQNVGNADSTGLAFGLCLVDSNGSRLIDQLPDEADQDFSRRVMEMASNLTVSSVKKISEAILRLSKPVDQVPLQKN